MTLQFRSNVGPPQTSHASAPAAVSCVGIDACLRAAAIGRPTRSKAKRFALSAIPARSERHAPARRSDARARGNPPRLADLAFEHRQVVEDHIVAFRPGAP